MSTRATATLAKPVTNLLFAVVAAQLTVPVVDGPSLLAHGAEPAAAAAQAARGDAEEVAFLRVKREGDEPVALEVAVVRCTPKNAAKKWPVVDLVAAVHVAEPSFYAELNKRFKEYDAVLYELVAPEGTRVRAGQRGGGNPVSMLQHGLTDVLELQFQLEGVDYQADNLVHADMSPAQLAESMNERGEGFAQMFARMLGYSLARQQQTASSDGQLLGALFSDNRAMALRRAMAEQFEDMPAMVRAIEGQQGSTLIAQRNKRALAVLRKQVDDGKKRLAIFYGAAHMDDMLDRLDKDFNLVPTKTDWLVAWKLQEKGDSP